MDRKPLDLASFGPSLRKHVDPKAPPPLRMMAAKGVAPMPPEEMAKVLYQLSLDADSQVASEAVNTLVNTPLDILKGVLTHPHPEQVLDWVAERRGERELLHLIIQNRSTGDHTITRLAKRADSETCDLIAENQVRLLEAPKIIEAMYMNPEARMSTVDKLIDLARRNGVSLAGLPGLRGLVESDVPLGGEVKVPEGMLEENPELANADGDEVFSQVLKKSLEEEKPADEEEEAKSTTNRAMFLSNLSVSNKIRFATLGSREDRSLLLRDSNRLVHMAAVSSPKMTEMEAVTLASNRSMPEAVISYIANNREWMRGYQVKVNLVNNPKLPLQTSLRLLNHLLPKDLKQLSANRNVPAQLARQAKTLMSKRNTRRKH